MSPTPGSLSTRYRSMTAPAITILVLSAGIGCDTAAKRERLRIKEETARWQAETESPTPEVLAQIQAAATNYMKDKHASDSVDGYSFTSLTPNLFLVGVNLKTANGVTIKQLSAERLREQKDAFLGGLKETGELLWVIDEVNAEKMRVLAERHGLEGEVNSIRQTNAGHTHSWGAHTWLDNYLLWHFIFRRPSPIYRPAFGSGFQPMPTGYRFHDPQGMRITPDDAKPYQGASAATGGRSAVFLAGSAWKPPLVSQLSNAQGQNIYKATRSGVTARNSKSTFSRGGFGRAGRSRGGFFGG